MAPEAMKPFELAPKTWAEFLSHSRQCRSRVNQAALRDTSGSFQFRPRPEGPTRVYSLGIVQANVDQTLMLVDVPAESEPNADSDLRPLVWQPLCTESAVGKAAHCLSKEEEFRRERMRCAMNGITSYEMDPWSGALLFSSGSHLFTAMDSFKDGKVYVKEVEGARAKAFAMDPKLCPDDPKLIAFVSDNDIWIYFDGFEIRATFTKGDQKGSTTSAGVPSFVIQEEFDRYSAMWWAPKATREPGKYLLLYEETDESGVEELGIGVPASRTEDFDYFRYPLAGTTNARSTLKLLDIRIQDERIVVSELRLAEDLGGIFPWWEYLTRAGWMPDGSAVWAQLMSRKQEEAALVHIPLDMFQDSRASMRDLSASPSISVLYRETTDTWINHSELLVFLSSPSPSEAKFLLGSECSGFFHLYALETALNTSDSASDGRVPRIKSKVSLTKGDWAVKRSFPPVVDEQRCLVYFAGLMDSPVETHVYVTSYLEPGPIRRLTQLGQCHLSQRSERSLSLNVESGLLVTWRSSLEQPPVCVVSRIVFSSGDSLPSAVSMWQLRSQTVARHTALMDIDEEEEDGNRTSSGVAGEDRPMPSPRLFSYQSSSSGWTHYALLFPPAAAEPGFAHPVVLYCYGGPEIQLVRNTWSSRFGLEKYTSLGYAVVMVDGRGSDGRGLQFEASLRHALGSVEVEDQVEGLLTVADRVQGLLDLSRVTIIGWSYGGYLALHALIKRPDVFKIAIAGGPVTSWRLYDTGYTERYMGLPTETPTAYQQGSVLAQAHSFPDEPGRLLILHGLIDENVHFQHSAQLIDALISAGKPYDLRIFPRERHGVRSQEGNEHMDATILDYLARNL